MNKPPGKSKGKTAVVLNLDLEWAVSHQLTQALLGVGAWLLDALGLNQSCLPGHLTTN